MHRRQGGRSSIQETPLPVAVEDEASPEKPSGVSRKGLILQQRLCPTKNGHLLLMALLVVGILSLLTGGGHGLLADEQIIWKPRTSFPPRIFFLENNQSSHRGSRQVKLDSLPYFPPVVFLEDEVIELPKRKVEVETSDINKDKESKMDKEVMTFDTEETGCPFIADWQEQTTAKPTCNVLHEIGLSVGEPESLNQLQHIASGAFKDVWNILDVNEEPHDYVLKTAMMDRGFSPKELNRHRRDALVMEEATASPYVLNIHGYCAFSATVETAHGTLRDWMRTHHGHLKRHPTWLLEIAIMIAGGLADVQLYHKGMATFAHADLKAAQILVTSKETQKDVLPVLKLNDFNRGRFLTSKRPPEICPFYMSVIHKSSTSRSPEEYARNGAQTDKIDVFSLGSIFYYLLVGKAPFESIGMKKGIVLILKDEQPELPKAVQESSDPSIVAIREAMSRCRQFNRVDRPGAPEVYKELRDALERIRAA